MVPYLPPFSLVANNGSPMKGEKSIFNRTYVYSILFCNIQLLCLPRVIKGLPINPHTNTIDHKNSYQLMNGEKNHPTHKLSIFTAPSVPPWMDREYFPYRRKTPRRRLEVRENLKISQSGSVCESAERRCKVEVLLFACDDGDGFICVL